MICDELAAHIMQLHATEKLSIRQIAVHLRLNRRTISRVIRDEGGDTRFVAESVIDPYRRLIESWYSDHPKLLATQVHERLRGLGFTGSYASVRRATRKLRARKPVMFHERVLLPGEEAQVDWMVLTLPFGTVYGFVHLLAWSRHLVVRFYPRMTFEFFLAGHLEAFRECGGVAHCHRYDNLKSVVIARKPELRLNAQFVDFARHFGFVIHPCTPYRANEKGRVERVIRDIRSFLYTQDPKDLDELNRVINRWCLARNNTVHSAIGTTPGDAVLQEPLKRLPTISYPARRTVPATVSKTGFIEVETNRYSAPSRYCGQNVTVALYPEKIEVIADSRPVATHRRLFGKKQTVEDPAHRTEVLAVTPAYKQKRIHILMTRMNGDIERFIRQGEEDGLDPLKTAYALFRLLRVFGKPCLLSAVREALAQKATRPEVVAAILAKPLSPAACPVTPQNSDLLVISYAERSLADYDPTQ